MPDLTLCNNAACPLRLSCYRFIAKRDEWQSMANFTPKDGKCDHFIEAKARSQVRRLEAQTGRWTEKIKFSE